MEGLKKWGIRLLNLAVVNPWKAFRKWLNKSRFVAYIAGAALAGSIVFCYLTIKYEYRDVFDSRIVIFNNTSVAVASSESENAGANQVVEKVTSQEVRGDEQSSPMIQTVQKYFGDEWKTAYAVMMAESGGNPKAPSTTDRLVDGRAFSVGLMQINLTWHKLGGIDCSQAFTGKDYNAVVTDEALYEKCVELASNPDINLETARNIYNKYGFNAWGAFTNGSYKRNL